MKRIVRSIAVVALMLASATNMANEPKLKTEIASKNLVLELDADNKKSSIKFVDSDGNIIYADYSVNAEEYIKKFNLETLPEGTYYLEIENSLKELVYTINVDNANIGIGDKKEVLKPVFRKKDDKVLVNLLNLEKKDVEIKIFDRNDEVVFDEVVSGEMLVQKAFTFVDLENTYTIAIKTEDDTYFENVSVK